jgi:hypothetical protein
VYWWGILKEEDDMKDMSLDGNIVLKLILKNMVEAAN